MTSALLVTLAHGALVTACVACAVAVWTLILVVIADRGAPARESDLVRRVRAYTRER